MKQKHIDIVERFDMAARDMAWMGSYEPYSHAEIKKNYEEAKTDLYKILEEK